MNSIDHSQLDQPAPGVPDVPLDDEGEEDEGSGPEDESRCRLSMVMIEGASVDCSFEDLPKAERDRLLDTLNRSQLRDLCKRLTMVLQAIGSQCNMDEDHFERLPAYVIKSDDDT